MESSKTPSFPPLFSAPVKLHILLPALFLLACGSPKSENAAPPAESEPTALPTAAEREIFNGTYCAQVNYHNPRTGTRSDYHLLVETSKGALEVIHWPGGGELDSDHFAPQAIGADSTVFIVSDRGVQYTVHLLGRPEACAPYFNTLRRCSGTTQSGERCRRATADPSGFCSQHRR